MSLRVEARAWDDPDGVALRTAQQDEIAERYGRDDSEPGGAPSPEQITLFLVAVDDTGAALGCGALRPLADDLGEVKRMFVVPGSRGSGISTTILRALEDAARDRGWRALWLETGDRQPDAIRFYEREGYTRIPNYGVYADSDISLCYEKVLS